VAREEKIVQAKYETYRKELRMEELLTKSDEE
jgi:hypothetical protein